MARKTNPVGLRLGKTQVWDSTIQNYGKIYKVYFQILHKEFQILKYLIRISFFYNFLIDHIELFSFNNKISLNIYYSYLKYNSFSSFHVFKKEFCKTIAYLINTHINTRFFLVNSWYSTANLVICYIKFLLQQEASFIKILHKLCKILTKYLNFQKVVYLKNGPIKMRLIGFKIRLAGRFDNSRNQMAKVIKYKKGSLASNNLQTYVEYSRDKFFTKFGTCGIQIWLFYKIQEVNYVNTKKIA